MNAAIEFHDSRITAIETSGGALRIIFSAAYVHCSLERPGIDVGQGFVQPIELVFNNAVCVPQAPVSAERISDGEVVVNGEAMSLLPIPLAAAGNISATFVFESNDTISITAKSIACYPTGALEFIEDFPSGEVP